MTKSIFASKTLWGLAVAAVATVVQRWGVSLGEADQAALVDALSTIGQTVGGIIAVYGRVTAQGPLTGSGSAAILAALFLSGSLGACAGAAPVLVAALPAATSALVGAGATYLAYASAEEAIEGAEGAEAKIKAGLAAYCGSQGARALDRTALGGALAAAGMDPAAVQATVRSLQTQGDTLCASAGAPAP